jgi:hypothetical protein
MRCQPYPASLTSRRRRAAPPVLGAENAACPNNEKASLHHLYLSKSPLCPRNKPNSYDLYALHERAAVRRRFRQLASKLQDFLLPLARTDRYTA